VAILISAREVLNPGLVGIRAINQLAIPNIVAGIMDTGRSSTHGLIGGARFPKRGFVFGMSACVIVIAATSTGAIADSNTNIQPLILILINVSRNFFEILSRE
jgi:hypothetical protein